MSQKYNIYFKFSGHYDTKSVEVVGDFNNWERGTCVLDDDDGDNTWWGEASLTSGVYQYKFLVDGEHYHLDPE
jgi:1,4-alpha-glucan branching enzyme